MKDKIISLVIGLFIGGIVVFLYSNYFIGSGNNELGTKGTETSVSEKSSGMNDEQLEKMAKRSGFTVDELKEKLDSGEDMKSIMKGGNNTGGSERTKTRD